MSIAGIGSSNSGWDWQAIVNESQQDNQTTGTTNASDSSGNGGMQSTNPILASLASVLNLSTSQIQQDLSNGQSLSQIASAQGVSQGTLLSAIESSLQSSPFGSSASSNQISTMASAIANNTGPFPPPPPSSQNSQDTSSGSGSQSTVSDLASDLVINLLQDLSQLASRQASSGSSATGASNSSDTSGSGNNNPMLSSLAPVLNLSASQIQQDQSDGQSLSQIASAQGVSQSTLLSAIESSLQNGPFGPSITSAQLTDMATTIADNTGAFPPPPSSSQDSQTSSTGSDQQSTVDELASSLANTFLQDLSQLAGDQTGSGGTTSSRDRTAESPLARG